jgi:hypothetical protein
MSGGTLYGISLLCHAKSNLGAQIRGMSAPAWPRVRNLTQGISAQHRRKFRCHFRAMEVSAPGCDFSRSMQHAAEIVRRKNLILSTAVEADPALWHPFRKAGWQSVFQA